MAKCICCGAELSKPVCNRCGYDVRSGVRLLTKPKKVYRLPKEEPKQEVSASASPQEEPIARFTRVETDLPISRSTHRKVVWKILLGVLGVTLLLALCIFGGKKWVDYRERTANEWWSEQGFTAEYDDRLKAYVITRYLGEESVVQIPGEFRRKSVVIGNNVFENNQMLEQVILSQGVSKIGREAFKDCINLKEIELAQSVEEIGAGAFENCESLTFVQIPDAVTEIEYNTFRNSGLTEIHFSGKETEIGWCAFSQCTELESVTIPESVTAIGFSAFEECSKLESVVIPKGVNQLGSAAFAHCANLQSVTIWGDINEMSVAFSGCKKLQFIRIPGSVQKITGDLGEETLLILYYAGTREQWEALDWPDKALYEQRVEFITE